MLRQCHILHHADIFAQQLVWTESLSNDTPLACFYSALDKVAYGLADEEFGDDGGMVPHWIFTEGRARIQRYSPVPPLSRDAERLAELRRSLTVYRMVFGQPRQEDFLEFILRQVPEERREKVAAALTVDLSPPNMLE